MFEKILTLRIILLIPVFPQKAISHQQFFEIQSLREPLSIHEWRLCGKKSRMANFSKDQVICQILLGLYALEGIISSNTIRSSRINRGSLKFIDSLG